MSVSGKTFASARMMESPTRHCRKARSERSMSYCSTGFWTRGPLVEITNGTASIRNPETPSWIQNPMILRISAWTCGLDVLRSGWNS